jgi:hypothetical protein
MLFFLEIHSETLLSWSTFLTFLDQPLNTKNVSPNLAELLQKNREFLGLWFLSYEFLFTTARTLCHYVCMLASSSNIRLYLCTNEYPSFAQHEKRTFFIRPYQMGNVLILELNLQLSSPPVKMLSQSTYIPSKPPWIYTYWDTELLWNWYPCHDYFNLSIMSVFLMVFLTTFCT